MIKFKKIKGFKTAVWIAAAISFSLIIIFTFKVILIVDNPGFFDIDFENESQTIISYASLIGAVLTFLSIMFVLLTISNQKDLFERDKQLHNTDKKNELKDRMSLIDFILDDITEHIEQSSMKMKDFYKKEQDSPLSFNKLEFLANKNYYRILELDFLTTFQAFKQSFTTEEKTKTFGNLYKIIDYYSESLSDLKSKAEYHQKDKFLKKSKLGKDFEALHDNNTRLIGKYRSILKKSYLDSNGYNALNKMNRTYREIVENPVSNEVDFRLLHNMIIDFSNDIKMVKFELEIENDYQLLIKDTTNISRELYSVINDSEVFAETIEVTYENFYATESNYVQKFNEIKTKIKNI